MGMWTGVLLFFVFSVASANTLDSVCENKNYDQIGTFLGGDDPFPWGRQVDLPLDTSGMWEVSNSPNGAYFVILDPRRGREESGLYMFDPCSFLISASGSLVEAGGALYSTMGYKKDQGYSRHLVVKAYQSISDPEKVDLVLIVMSSNKSVIDKYFPIVRIDYGSLGNKCEK